MTRTYLIVGAMLLGQSLCAGTAAAVVITLQPASSTVVVGKRFDVSVAISDLGDSAPPSLSIIDLEIGFESASVSFISAEFGDPAQGDQLDLLGFGSSTEVTPSASLVNLFELSLDLPEDLVALQGNQFVFAMIAFEALAAGTSPLSISVNTLGDSLGDPLDATATGAQVTVVEALEPSGPWLLVLIVLGIAVGSRAVTRHAPLRTSATARPCTAE